MVNPQIFRMGNNQLMIVENGVTRIVKDKKILSMTNEEMQFVQKIIFKTIGTIRK